ncbi:MAG: pentapeptide repeat-containing protein [Acidobacteriota bacterium]
MTFRKTTFEHVNFSSATFKGAVTFAHADFQGDANFNSTVFEQEASFHTTSFKAKADFPQTGKVKVDFSQAKFGGHADFSEATFEEDGEHNFWDAKFLAGTNFEKAKFEGRTNFDAVTFKGETNFNYATFNETVNFRETTFQDRVFFEATAFTGKAKFFHTSFKDYVRFRGQVFLPGSRPDFRAVKSVELISFYSLTSRPHWFVDLNASKFALTNVRWEWRRITLDREIRATARNHKGLSPYPLLERACRNLAINAEENHRYEEASSFRYMAMEARRQSQLVPEAYWRLRWKEARTVLARLICSLGRRNRRVSGRMLTKSKLFWKSFLREFNWKLFWRSFSWNSFKSFWGSFGWLHWLYWLASGYGERIWQAALVLVGLLVLFASLFFFGQQNGQWWQAPQTSSPPGAPAKASPEQSPQLLGFGEAVIYSAGVMTLQNPAPQPANPQAKLLVLIETVLGPVQAALLALAVRRKFMR